MRLFCFPCWQTPPRIHIHDRSTVTQVVLNSLNELLHTCQIFSNFQNAVHAGAFCLVRSLSWIQDIRVRYMAYLLSIYLQRWRTPAEDLKLLSYILSFGTLMMRPRCSAAAAVLVCFTCALGVDDSSNAMSSAKFRSFKKLAMSPWLTKVFNYTRLIVLSCSLL